MLAGHRKGFDRVRDWNASKLADYEVVSKTEHSVLKDVDALAVNFAELIPNKRPCFV